jgi:hypothetical protein
VCTNNQCVTPPFDCSTCNCGCNGTQTDPLPELAPVSTQLLAVV